MTDLSSAFALMGLTSLALSLILSIRSACSDKVFKGLRNLFILHHYTATTGIALIFFHGAIEVASLGFELESLTAQWQEPGLLWAWMAVLLFIVVVYFARINSLKHKTWLRIHRLGILAWFSCLMHIYAFRSNDWLFTYYVSLGLLGTMAIVRSQILPQLACWGVPFKVKSVNSLNSNVFELILSPPASENSLVTSTAQYYYLRFCSKNFSRQWHPFTCLSNINEGELKFAIKTLGNDTQQLENLKINDRVDVEGPFGHLHERVADHELWIVGGVGINPLLSCLMQGNVEKMYEKKNIHVIHAVEDEKSLIYQNEIEEIKKKLPQLDYQLWITSQKGFLNSFELKKSLTKVSKNSEIYVAGPPLFINHVKKLLKSEKVNYKKIHTEEKIK